MEESDDEKDPVVREIPVYLNRLDSSTTTNDLYLLQYPLRPAYRPYGDHGQLCRIQRRPESKRLRLTYSLNVEGEQFDESAKSQLRSLIALKADKKTTDKDEEELDALSFHRLDSTFAKNEGQCEYGIGLKSDDAFFIIPLTRVLQFRPDFGHIDRANEMAKLRAMQSSARMATETASTNTSPTAASESSDATNAVKARISATHAQVRRRENQEELQDVEVFFDPDSPEAAEVVNMLTTFQTRYLHEVASVNSASHVMTSEAIGDLLGLTTESLTQQTPEKSTRYEIRTSRVRAGAGEIPNVHFDGDLQSYFTCLSAGCAESTLAGTKHDDSTSGIQTGPLSWLAMSKLSLEEQVKRIMKVRHIEKFTEIRAHLTSQNHADKVIIDYLLKYAYPLKGAWVVKSEILFEEIESQWTVLERWSRDLLLCFIANNVPGKNIIDWRSKSVLPIERTNALIQSLYTIRNAQLMSKIEGEPEFEAAHANLFAETCQTSLSKARAGEIFALLEEKTREGRNRVSEASAEGSLIDLLDPLLVQKAVEMILRKHGASTDGFINDTVKQYLKETIENETRTRLATGAVQVVERSRILEEAARRQSALEKLRPQDLRDTLTRVAEIISDLWVLRELGNSQLDPYRRVVLHLFRENPEKGITKRDFREACTKILRRNPDLPDIAYRQIFREMARNISGFWYFKASTTVQQRNLPDAS